MPAERAFAPTSFAAAPSPENGRYFAYPPRRVPFADASVDQVRAAATRLARNAPDGGVQESPIATALRKLLRGELGHVTVRVSGGTVSFGQVGVHHIAALGKALRAFAPPR